MLSLRLAAAAAALAVALPSTARADESPTSGPAVEKHRKKKHKKTRAARDEAGTTVTWSVAGTAGMLSGSGTLPERAATTGVLGAIEPSWHRGKLELGVPTKLAHRQTFGASLRETDARTGVAASYRDSPRLRFGGGLELRGVYRPDWPDEYQPLADGSLAGTDRRSHFDLGLGASVTGIPLRHWHARLAWEVARVDYADDPNYDMLDEPTHLVPGDHVAHKLDGDWRYFADGWKAGVGLEIGYESYARQFARDAGTGLTHAGAGGPPPNPLYKQASFEPALEGDLDLAGGAAELDVSYGYEMVNDLYEGYYTYRGHHPRAKLKWRRGQLEAAVKADLKWRTYGPDSYAAGPNHPALEDGDRRVDHRFGSGIDLRYGVSSHWAVIGEADALIRRTNYPDYVPNVFPASRPYEIAWDYDNFVVEAGLEYRP